MKLNSAYLFVPVIILFSSTSNAQEEIIAKDAELQLISDDYEFTEGPAADSLGNVFFTDQPNNRILKWNARENNVSVFMEEAGRSNGLYFDNDGKLLACADENSELWKIDMDGKVTVLVEDFRGKRLNGPNDLWIDHKGGIYFTDPYYQRDYWERTEKEIEKERVYYLSPSGELKIAAEDLVKPNGIIGTPDGKTLYVADIGDDKTYSYSMASDGSLTNRNLFTKMGSDGMTIDNRGNIYLTGEGVTVFNKEGKQIKHIPIDKDWTANVTFGGEDRQTLFITAMDAVYSLKMQVKGVR